MWPLLLWWWWWCGGKQFSKPELEIWSEQDVAADDPDELDEVLERDLGEERRWGNGVDAEFEECEGVVVWLVLGGIRVVGDGGGVVLGMGVGFHGLLAILARLARLASCRLGWVGVLFFAVGRS